MTRSEDGSSWPQVGRDSGKSASIEGWWKGELPRPTRWRRLKNAASSPVAVGRWIAYVSRERSLVLRDHRTGQQAWDADVGQETYWSARSSYDVFGLAEIRRSPAPAPAIAGEVICVRSSQDFVLRGFALDTGRSSGRQPPTPPWRTRPSRLRTGSCWSVTQAVGATRSMQPGEPRTGPSRSGRRGSNGHRRPPTASPTSRWAMGSSTNRHPQWEGVVACRDGRVYVGVRWRIRRHIAGRQREPSSRYRHETGERRWRRRFRSVIDGGLAISGGWGVASGHSAVYAVSLADGALRWACELDGNVGSPSVAGDVIFVAVQGPYRLTALSLVEGRELWNVELEGTAVGMPVPLHGRVPLPSTVGSSMCGGSIGARRPPSSIERTRASARRAGWRRKSDGRGRSRHR